MYGWHPTVYKVWAYFILANMYPLILVERLMLFVYNIYFRGEQFMTRATKWTPVPEHLNKRCPKCMSISVEYKWLTSPLGDEEDYNEVEWQCKNCTQVWWTKGIDDAVHN